MRYKITHTTEYLYSEPVPVCQNQVLLTPRDGPGQHCGTHRLVIRPAPTTSARRKDYYGNMVHAFSIEQSHRKLTVTASSRVDLMPTLLPERESTTPWEQVVARVRNATETQWFDACQFLYDSHSIRRNADLGDYAANVFQPGRPILDAVLALTAKVHTDFKYDTRATNVTTSTEEAFRLRRGVCQDYAHVQIGCLRSIGVPARYVSGYLRTIPPAGRPRLIGADQSHAWLSVFCGDAGWIDVDPTNNVPCATDHVTLAWGRDYSDVCPIKGTFIGGGSHSMTVSVDVLPIENGQ